MKNIKYLIIGNGIAGLSAAKEIRKNDKVGSVLMISREKYLTYYRTRLTDGLNKDMKAENILVNKLSWYEENNIDVILNGNVERINAEENIIELSDGEKIKYDKLLLATGSHPFVPPIKGNINQDVLALRTIDDLYYFKDCLNKWEEVTVIGGGLLGLEAAWSIKNLGKKVKIVEFAPYLLGKQLNEEISKKLESRLIEEGLEIYLSSTVEEVLDDNTVVLNTGKKFKTDGLLYSIGVRPNLELVKDTDIKYNRGIIVDDNLRTNINSIYAAGDVIEKDGIVLGLWTLANEQGKIAGANMSGKDLKYTWPQPFTMLKLGDIQLFSIGNIKEYDKSYEIKKDNGKIHHKLFTVDSKIVGGILFGDTKDMGKLKKAVSNEQNIDTYLK